MSIREIKISDLCRIIRGVSYSPDEVIFEKSDGFKPLLKSNNIKDGKILKDELVFVKQNRIAPEQYLREHDVLITASTGSKSVIGKAATYTENKLPTTFGSFCIVLRPDPEKIYPNYFGYYFQTNQYRKKISSMAQGANINNIRQEYFDRLYLRLPPLPEQQRIVKTLDTIQGLIDKRKETIRLLDEYIKAVFLDMFGDPVTNPKGWEKIKCKDLFEIKLGKMLSAKNYTGLSLRKYLRNVNVKWGEIDLTDVKEMDFSDKEIEIYSLTKGDILVCEGGEIGKTAILHEDLPDYGFQNALHRLRIKDKKQITPEYFYWFMKIGVEKGILNKYSNSVTIAHFTREKFLEFEIPVPDHDLMRLLGERYRKVKVQTNIYYEQFKSLVDLFNSQNLNFFI